MAVVRVTVESRTEMVRVRISSHCRRGPVFEIRPAIWGGAVVIRGTDAGFIISRRPETGSRRNRQGGACQPAAARFPRRVGHGRRSRRMECGCRTFLAGRISRGNRGTRAERGHCRQEDERNRSSGVSHRALSKTVVSDNSSPPSDAPCRQTAHFSEVPSSNVRNTAKGARNDCPRRMQRRATVLPEEICRTRKTGARRSRKALSCELHQASENPGKSGLSIFCRESERRCRKSKVSENSEKSNVSADFIESFLWHRGSACAFHVESPAG